MAKLRMLPAEGVVHRLHPSPASLTPAYAAAAAHLLLAWLLHWLFASQGWAEGSDASPWRFWDYLYGNAAIATLLGLAALVAGALLWAWSLPARLASLFLGIAATPLLLILALWSLPYQQAIPAAVAAAGVLRALLTEAHRLTSWILLTNLRMVHKPGFLSGRVAQARYTDITDVDARQGPLSRLVGSGTLTTVLRGQVDPALPAVERFPGIHPFHPVRDLAVVMVQEATSSPALQAQQRTKERKRELAQRLGIRA